MKVFITGSSDGLGLLTAIKLVEEGHQVVLHARNTNRFDQTVNKVPNAERVLIADLASLEETKKLANDVNEMGEFDAIIHNAGVNRSSNELIFKVNCLAPYVLTSLIKKPKRLIYLGSGMHLHTKPDLKNVSKGTDYSRSKLYILMLSMAVARKWTGVYVNTVNPGWVPTKMGGSHAPDDLQKGVETQTWLSVNNDNYAKVSGKYFFHQKEAQHNQYADEISLQEQFLEQCKQLSGVSLPN